MREILPGTRAHRNLKRFQTSHVFKAETKAPM
jgi:hypothetical protein